MKIGATPAQPPVPGPGQGASSGDGAFGFDELGMFGLRTRAPSGLDGPWRTPGAPERPLPAQEGGEGRPESTSGGAELAPPALPRPPGPGCQGEAPPPPVGRLVLPEAPANEGVAAGRAAATAADGDLDAAPAEKTPLLLLARPRSAGPAHRLMVALDGGAASIAVKAPPLDADGRALLRRLLRQILAERRLGLADFHLNGVSLAADFNSMTGGSHGPRAR